ncbi:phage regulatory protein/antirepressor Ant [Marinilactibacillus psychrotolerans]|uniref:Phage regulatory protein/antirepressor Ant n=2 Tax=Marinilactibacillus psychrotolerans TaxID=191770 RepID=A0A5R9C6Z5_9LACT|nr:phage regulatory protein/antirepressor Ant [Marinilactibacillus psychrotolerans]
MIEIVNQHNQVVTTSKNVADNFGKYHKNIIRDIERLLEEDRLNFEPMFYEGEEPDSYGRPQKVYYMNRDGFSFLVMGFTGKRAIQFKLAYIEQFNQMEKQLIEAAKDSYMIDDPVARAEKWIQEQEKTKQLALENESMKPKAAFADSVTASGDTILIRDLSRFLKQNGMNIGQNRLFEKLRQDGYLIKSGSRRNTPTQKAMDLGLFKTTERTIQRSEGSQIKITTKVTGKGQYYFINKYLEEFNSEVNRR